MNKLILREGKTDAILLSYYLEKTCGWTHGNAPKGLNPNRDSLRCYVRNEGNVSFYAEY